MVKGCAPKIAKMTLFVLNFGVWCCSVVLLSLGIWMSVRSSKFAELFSEDYISTVAYMMIGIGAFLFIVGFSGCCGAKRESKFWLNIYFILMLAIIIAEVAAGIMAFVYSSQMEEFMRIGMNQTIATNYGYYDSATEVVDTLQENFECCGANSYEDYTYSAFMQESIGRAVPISCCKTAQDCGLGTPGHPAITLSVWPDGCVSVSIDTAKSNVVALGAVCLAVLAVEILSMIFARCMIKSIKREKHTTKTKTKKVKSKPPPSSKKGTTKSSSSKNGGQPGTNPYPVTYQPTALPYQGPPPNVANPYHQPPTLTEQEVMPIAVAQNPVQNKYANEDVPVNNNEMKNVPKEQDNAGYF